jgi:hypothetical protein
MRCERIWNSNARRSLIRCRRLEVGSFNTFHMHKRQEFRYRPPPTTDIILSFQGNSETISTARSWLSRVAKPNRTLEGHYHWLPP